PLESVRAGARTGLFDMAPRPRLARGGAAGAIGRAQVQLAGKTRGAVVVLDPAHHRVRAAMVLLLVARALLARRGRLAVPGLAPGTRTAGFLGGSGCCGQFGLLAQALGLRLFFLALALGLLGPLAVFLGQALLLAQVALARLLQLAQDLRALLIAVRGRGGGVLLGGLVQHHLLAHEHVDRLAVLAAAHGQLLLAVAAEGDLPGRDRIGTGLARLAVGAPQET